MKSRPQKNVGDTVLGKLALNFGYHFGIARLGPYLVLLAIIMQLYMNCICVLFVPFEFGLSQVAASMSDSSLIPQPKYKQYHPGIEC